MTISDIAETVGISRRFVYKWVQRFRAQGVEGLRDKPGRGSRPRRRRDLQAAPPTRDTYAKGAQAK
jgi:transposase